MRWLRWLGFALLAIGGGLIAASIATSEGQLILILFIPVFVGSGLLGLFGILAVFIGLFLSMTSYAWGPGALRLEPEGMEPVSPVGPPPPAPTRTARRKFGGFVMIGPIPIIFGSDQRIATWMIVLGFVLLSLTVIVWLLLLRGFP